MPGQSTPAAQHMGPGAFLVAGQGIYEESSTQKFPLGTRVQVGDRTFHYALAGAAIQPGLVACQPALAGCTTTLQTAVPVAVATSVGATRVYVTAVTTAQAANLFQEGYAIINDVSLTPDGVYTYRIKSHTALAITGTASYIDLYDEIPVALSTSDRLALMINMYKSIITAPVTTAVGAPVGVPPISVTSAYYFWLQTWGPCGILMDVGATGIGTDLIMTTTPALAGSPIVDTAALVGVRIGYILQIGTDDQGCIAYLQIAP